jgi:UDP-2,4-diacetamido-2,4,6-trideoxy-beta-L-altropyranose hydrolase
MNSRDASDPAPWLLVRAEASNSIGTGHVMRMLALAQAWQDKFHGERPARVTLACREIPPALQDRLLGEGVEVWRLEAKAGGAGDAREIIECVNRSGACPSWIVADGYFFTIEFQHKIRAKGLRLAVMDDNGENGAYDCDVILNQNIMARESMYNRHNRDARLLLGTQYALLRREFRVAEPKTEEMPRQVERIMVTFGGSDTAELVIAVVEVLRDVRPQLHIRCVLGSLAGDSTQLENMRVCSPHRVEVLNNVRDMTGIMRWADLSINAAGSTTWELCAMGVPMIVTVLAENQRLIAEGLAARDCAVSAGPVASAGSLENIRHLFLSLYDDRERRYAMAQRARKLVDGRGATRVVEALMGNEEGIGR